MIKTSYDPETDAMFIWLVPEGRVSAHSAIPEVAA